ncbi:hypothetical protein [Catenovulum sediminis]|uniref:hypothetical protein n=1 Tax=Catenovulum sediminis TaxID=1740262 RepID=UPI0011806386|nr:hypothetical protein [Catenovulum sediminis]
MNIKKVGFTALLAGAAVLAGCGGSDSGNSNSTSYLTYYNLSSNTAVTKLYSEDSLLASVSYESKSSRQAVAAGTNTIELRVDEADDVTTTLYEAELNLAQDKRNYLVSVGALSESGGDEPLFFTYDINNVDDDFFEFNLMHLAKEFGQTATLEVVDNSSKNVVETITIDFGESITQNIELDKYYFQIKNPAGEVQYTSSSIEFGSIQYFFALKDEVLNDQNILTMTRLVDSFTTPVTYKDKDLKSYFRLYNSAQALGNVDMTMSGVTYENETVISGQAPDTLPDSSVELNSGSYKVTLSGTSIQGALYSFASGEDKTIVFYRDAEGQLDDVSFSNTNRADTSNHQITFVNLLNNQGENEVDLYFVAPNTNFESTLYRITQRQLGDVSRIAIPSATYDIFLAVDDGDGAPKVLAEELGVTFGSGDNTGDWVIFAETAEDNEMAVEGGVSILNRVKM